MILCRVALLTDREKIADPVGMVRHPEPNVMSVQNGSIFDGTPTDLTRVVISAKYGSTFGLIQVLAAMATVYLPPSPAKAVCRTFPSQR